MLYKSNRTNPLRGRVEKQSRLFANGSLAQSGLGETSEAIGLRSQRRSRKSLSPLRCRHMIAVYAVQYLAPDLSTFYFRQRGHLAKETTWSGGMILVVSGNALICRCD